MSKNKTYGWRKCIKRGCENQIWIPRGSTRGEPIHDNWLCWEHNPDFLDVDNLIDIRDDEPYAYGEQMDLL